MYSKRTYGRKRTSARKVSNGKPNTSRFSRRNNRGGENKRGKKNGGESIHPSRFVNKAIITESATQFVPEHAFTDFAIEDALKRNIIAKGYTEPTPIQDRIIPHILKGHDVIGIANTGTGKTGAFLIPLINKILLHKNEQILIMAPTRELAVQINDELKDLTRLPERGHSQSGGQRIFSVCCVGGMPIGPQLRALKQFNNVVVGTPGRLKDLMEKRALKLDTFGSLVLDEADRMLDMGFIDDMRFIVSHMPDKRHTLFFSATMSPEIEKLTNAFLHEPVSISVKQQDTAKNVDQDVVRINRHDDKLDILHNMLSKEEFNKVLIFGRTKHGVEKLSKMLAKKGLDAISIHGDKNHAQRQRALRSFKEGKAHILVATDVAARGLDIPNVSHVINFDVPATYDDYVHRIGRTGRGDKSGIALTFVE